MTTTRRGDRLKHRQIRRSHSAKSVQVVCQKRRSRIAKPVRRDRQNGSTGLVSFHECDKEVSLRGFRLYVAVGVAGVAAQPRSQTGGEA